jgi:hypothetical protein
MSEGPQITLTRRAVCAGGIGLLGAGLGGCSFVSLKTQNFRLTVEDNTGKMLGSGVWQWQENIPWRAMYELVSKDGEAFPIVHPTLGKMYVTRRNDAGRGGLEAEDILLLYQDAGLIPKFERHAPRGGIGAVGFREIARMKTRVELALIQTHHIARFSDESQPGSVRIIPKHSQIAPAQVVFRFFVQPTSDRMTTGIIEHLPWLNSLPSRRLHSKTELEAHDFVDNKTASRLNDAYVRNRQRQ